MSNFLDWLFARLSERSTWAGATTLLTAAGVAVSPDQANLIATAGVAVVGAIFAFTKDKPGA
jgi:hypothetical protein